MSNSPNREAFLIIVIEIFLLDFLFAQSPSSILGGPSVGLNVHSALRGQVPMSTS